MDLFDSFQSPSNDAQILKITDCIVKVADSVVGTNMMSVTIESSRLSTSLLLDVCLIYRPENIHATSTK